MDRSTKKDSSDKSETEQPERREKMQGDQYDLIRNVITITREDTLRGSVPLHCTVGVWLD